ncbi:MAG: hypothetical protein WCV56_07225 [Candidatus Omnitrophota bacterium]
MRSERYVEAWAAGILFLCFFDEDKNTEDHSPLIMLVPRRKAREAATKIEDIAMILRREKIWCVFGGGGIMVGTRRSIGLK